MQMTSHPKKTQSFIDLIVHMYIAFIVAYVEVSLYPSSLMYNKLVHSYKMVVKHDCEIMNA